MLSALARHSSNLQGDWWTSWSSSYKTTGYRVQTPFPKSPSLSFSHIWLHPTQGALHVGQGGQVWDSSSGERKQLLQSVRSQCRWMARERESCSAPQRPQQHHLPPTHCTNPTRGVGEDGSIILEMVDGPLYKVNPSKSQALLNLFSNWAIGEPKDGRCHSLDRPGVSAGHR